MIYLFAMFRRVRGPTLVRPAAWLGLVVLAAGLVLGAASGQEARPGPVLMVEVEGAIGPATAARVEDAVDTARERGADVLILRLDTPGGLDASMRSIVQAVLASPVPVVTWVGPSGARAASAGTFILYASHVAAMAPGTNLGAATPVPIGGAPVPEEGSEPSAMERKVINDAVAYIQGLAEMRGRDAGFAERAVREGASLAADAARKDGVVDLLAANEAELLAMLDGRAVETATGARTLATRGAAIETLEPTWQARLLGVITDPTIAYLLLLVGIYGLILEVFTPGTFLPGVTGAICLLLALYAFQLLPVDLTGLALIALGVLLIVAEAFAPSFGALGIGGMVAFVAGSIMLMDTGVPGFAIAGPVIAGVALAGAGLLLAIVVLVTRGQKRGIATGKESLIGSAGLVRSWHAGSGRVTAQGEIWQAHGPDGLLPGQAVRIRALRGLTVEVEPDLQSPTEDAS
ncbi:NfeD family protein [Marinivivus vitaminiproducens]|uniref:NfeD family protein n=1 Tax=Marinivivus vitaminiproducens TaxID=3035935 RepID=UPI0027A27C65|nr:nodulation protein NfeD [Geminicoccaceae bacterium SCSIO 64248]